MCACACEYVCIGACGNEVVEELKSMNAAQEQPLTIFWMQLKKKINFMHLGQGKQSNVLQLIVCFVCFYILSLESDTCTNLQKYVKTWAVWSLRLTLENLCANFYSTIFESVTFQSAKNVYSEIHSTSSTLTFRSNAYNFIRNGNNTPVYHIAFRSVAKDMVKFQHHLLTHKQLLDICS